MSEQQYTKIFTCDWEGFKSRAKEFCDNQKGATQEQKENGFKALSISALNMTGTVFELQQAGLLLTSICRNYL